VFVDESCEPNHIESFNMWHDKNIQTLRVLESKWDLIRKKLAKRLVEKQDKGLLSYLHKRAGRGAREGTWKFMKAGNMSVSTYERKEGAGEP